MERADHGDDESDESFAPEQVRRPKEPKQAAKVQRRVTLMTPVLVTDADLQKTWAKKIDSYKVGEDLFKWEPPVAVAGLPAGLTLDLP